MSYVPGFSFQYSNVPIPASGSESLPKTLDSIFSSILQAKLTDQKIAEIKQQMGTAQQTSEQQQALFRLQSGGLTPQDVNNPAFNQAAMQPAPPKVADRIQNRSYLMPSAEDEDKRIQILREKFNAFR